MKTIDQLKVDDLGKIIGKAAKYCANILPELMNTAQGDSTTAGSNSGRGGGRGQGKGQGRKAGGGCGQGRRM